MLVILVAVAVIAVAGAVAAVALTRDSTPTATTPRTTTPPPQDVTPPPPTSDESTTSLPPTPPPAPAPAPNPEPASGRLIIGRSYSVRIPAGFDTVSSGIFHQAHNAGEKSYTESQWRSRDDFGTEIHIDYTTPFDGDVEASTRGLRSRRHQGAGYREYFFGSYTREDGSEAWRWHFSSFEDGVEVHRVAYYTAGCNTGYALLGVTPTSSWDRLSSVFDAAAASLRPRC
jgi:hypothetical protein